MNKGTKIKKLRKSGFRSRINKVSGKRILKARRRKKRYKISLS
uniref:50S ribosomal protein L34 n=1 Tax=Dasya binghamiae TaxID=1896963 RepID=A0A1C8XRY6_9FLOR|nr:50S ribosomal protein L34 [Dasya binghamiae]AOH77233.1 50S ribosomal protein L34 [Dasya binghamiae]